jgi:hypothetical protein
MEVEIRDIIVVEKECLDSREDIEHNHQTLINMMKEQYQKDVEVFAKATHLANNM